MKNFIIGAIFGIVISTVGMNGIAKLFDSCVAKVKQTTQDIIKNQTD